MGLDMYFTVKRSNLSNDILMCVNGAIPLGIKGNGKQIGYLRKAYFIHEFMLDLLEVNHEDINCESIPLNDIHIKAIRDEIEFRFENEYFIDSWDEDDWKELKEIFDKVKQLQKEPDTEFFYLVWY